MPDYAVSNLPLPSLIALALFAATMLTGAAIQYRHRRRRRQRDPYGLAWRIYAGRHVAGRMRGVR